MGSCVSLPRDPDSAMKLRLSVESKNDSSSPVNGNSKEETFFDSQPWLESDSEDDFCSVNGDFTPSRGSTPVHHSFSLANKTSAVEETITIACVSELSPTDKKNTLSELFSESLRGDESKATEPNSINLSGASTETSPNGVLKTEGKPFKSTQCCLPKLISSRSISERKRGMSPARSVG